jgi:hypothetical protein
MALTTKDTSNQTGGFNRKEKTEELMKYHQKVFNALGVSNPLYIPKCAYRPYGKDELHMGFFKSELCREQDIYTEYTSISLESEDPTRTLYKWKYNPFYDEEYETTEPNGQGHVRYLIPVSELIKVMAEPKKTEPTKTEVEGLFPDFDGIMDADLDAPLSSLTVRDLAAILLQKPVSNKKWLNDLIK